MLYEYVIFSYTQIGHNMNMGFVLSLISSIPSLHLNLFFSSICLFWSSHLVASVTDVSFVLPSLTLLITNDMTTISWAPLLFLVNFCFHYCSGLNEKLARWSFWLFRSEVSYQLTYSNFRAILVTWLKLSNQSHSLRLTWSSVALNQTGWLLLYLSISLTAQDLI